MKVKEYLEKAKEYFKIGICLYDEEEEVFNNNDVKGAKSLIEKLYGEYEIEKISDCIELKDKTVIVIPVLYIRKY